MKSFENFLNTNRRAWQADLAASQSSSRRILVELFADHPGYIMGNLVVAGHLATILGAKLVALLDGRACVQGIALAHSYGIQEVVFLEDIADQSNIEAAAAEYSAKVKTRDDLLKVEMNGVPAGDLIYDSYLRRSGNASVFDTSDTLVDYLTALVHHNAYEKLFNAFDIQATVQGHMVYEKYGLLGRVAMKHGAEVFSRKPSASNFTVKHYTGWDQLFEHEFCLSRQQFDALSDECRAMLRQTGQDYLHTRVFNPKAVGDVDAQAAFGDKRVLERAELAQAMGLDPDKPMAVIMAHCYPDAPHSGQDIPFADYWDWMVCTLRFAKTYGKHINWVVKEHPALSHYSPKQDSKTAMNSACPGAPNVVLCPADVATTSLLQSVDAMVTVMGTASLEFPAFGVPAITLGKGLFSGYGVNYEATTMPDYFKFLAQIGEMPRPTPEQRAMVETYAGLYFVHSKVRCKLMPPITAAFYDNLDHEAFWQEAADILTTMAPADDPIRRYLRTMLERGDPNMVDYDAMGITEAQAVA